MNEVKCKTQNQMVASLYRMSGGMHRNEVVTCNWNCYCWFEMDFCKITKAKNPTIHEFECKTNFQDFKKDWLKSRNIQMVPGDWSTSIEKTKHEWLNTGTHHCFPHFFSFVVCPSIKDKVMKYLDENGHSKYGVYSYDANDRFTEFRAPTRLKPNKCESEQWKKRLDRALSDAHNSLGYRYWDMKIATIQKPRPLEPVDYDWTSMRKDHEYNESGSCFDI